MEDKFRLAGYQPADLLNIYQRDLFEYYLPYLDQYVYDHEYGGFMCHTDRKGNQITTQKRTWYDGRGVWVYSFLYRYFGQDEWCLKRASQTVEFLLSVESSHYPFWPWGYTRTGSPLKDHKADIYGSLFVAEGLTGFAAATKEEQYLLKAKNILFRCVNEYDKNGYEYIPHFQTSGKSLEAPRVLGHWMILLNLCGHILEQQEDSAVKSLSDRCIGVLLGHHLHPGFNLLIEYLNHDLTLPGSPQDQFAYTGHGIEVLWMVMAEADRRNDSGLFDMAYGLFKRHVEVAWDDVQGGFFHELTHAGKNKWLLDKVLWAQEEVLVGLMLLIAKNRDEWAIRWFDKVYPYVRKHFILHEHPVKLWINGGDRQMEEHHQIDRFENYHHPRHLMKNILALKRMENI